MKNNYNLLLILFIFLLQTSCTGIIDNLAETNIKGGWNASTIKDVKTNSIRDVNINANNIILGDKIGDALYFNEDNSFVIFSQKSGNTGNSAGTYDVDLLTLTLNFTGGKSIKRSLVTVSETELIMKDTIGGIAKEITYVR